MDEDSLEARRTRLSSEVEAMRGQGLEGYERLEAYGALLGQLVEVERLLAHWKPDPHRQTKDRGAGSGDPGLRRPDFVQD